MKDLGDIVTMAARLPDEMRKAERRGVQQAALHVTRGVRQQIKVATGGDNRLSGVGKRGSQVGARYDVKGTVDPTALVRATGPIQLIEHPTRPHEITVHKRRGKRALRLGEGRYAASVQHPGTKPSRPFAKGVRATQGDTGRIFDKQVQAGIRRAIR